MPRIPETLKVISLIPDARLSAYLACLEPRHSEIFLAALKGKKQSAIATEFSTSQAYVSGLLNRIARAILKQERKALNAFVS